MTTTPAKPHSSQRSADDRLLYLAYERKVFNASLAIAAGVACALLYQHYLPLPTLLVWVAAILLTNLLGLIECFFFKRAAPQGPEAERWKLIFTAQSVLAGLGWGLGPALLLSSATGNAAVLLVASLFAVCVVAILSVAQIKQAMQGFVIAAMLPSAVAALLAPGGLENLVGLVLLAGMVVIFGVGTVSANILQRENETQVHLQGILDNAQDAVITLDAVGTVTRWNASAEQMFGRTRDEVIGKPLDTALLVAEAPGEPQPVLRRLLVAQANRPNARFEMQAQRQDGTAFSVEIAITQSVMGQQKSYTAFVADIAKRKDFEQQLAVFRRVFDASSQCMVIADAKGYGLYQNPAHERALGYSNEELLGKYFIHALPTESAQATVANIRKSLMETGEWSDSLVFQRKDGSQFTSHSSIGSIADAEGRIQYLFNAFTDITGMLAEREVLRVAKEEAERATRAKSDFLSSMSHELRTPLNAILGFAQMLEMDAQLAPGHQDSAKEIAKGGRHLLNMVNQVLESADIEAGKLSLSLEPLRVAEVVDEAWRKVRRLATERGVTFYKEAPHHLVVVADRLRLKQVLLNLMTNAIQYNRPGGELAVRLLSGDDGLVKIEVTDTGVGIPADQIKDVFQGFIRLGRDQSTTEGSGMGLSICRQLVGLMQGRIGVISEVSAGTTFWVELPASRAGVADPVMDAEAPDSRLDGASRAQCVLCIDDNPVNLKLIEQILRKRPGVELITASTPGLGIQMALARQPSLILLDINMPGMDGYQVLEILKNYERTKYVPVIAVTANPTPSDFVPGGASGLVDYLTKPLDVKKFLATVDEWLAQQV